MEVFINTQLIQHVKLILHKYPYFFRKRPLMSFQYSLIWANPLIFKHTPIY